MAIFSAGHLHMMLLSRLLLQFSEQDILFSTNHMQVVVNRVLSLLGIVECRLLGVTVSLKLATILRLLLAVGVDRHDLLLAADEFHLFISKLFPLLATVLLVLLDALFQILHHTGFLSFLLAEIDRLVIQLDLFLFNLLF